MASSEERGRRVWDRRARSYERQIITGHPDVFAYQQFEEDLLDRLLLHLIRDQKQSTRVLDVGCGSGRLHLRYGKKMIAPNPAKWTDQEDTWCSRSASGYQAPDQDLGPGLVAVHGIDFSVEMIDLAETKVRRAGLEELVNSRLTFARGSAFHLPRLPGKPLPVAVTLCNTIGVMQGREGATRLFRSLRRAVERGRGIAIISAYRKEAIPDYGLNNYESTMDVCGQPRWLFPDTYASADYSLRPCHYKRARDDSPRILVDVFRADGALELSDFVLERDPRAVQRVREEGHITTYTDYESFWYSFDQFDRWIAEYWGEENSHHLAGQDLDPLRAEPAQIAIFDPAHRLSDLLNRWNSDPFQVRQGTRDR